MGLGADREKLEKLCRYAARPAVAESRLVELADGRIGHALKRRWRGGTTAVVMTKAVLMERLCALVTKPRKHLVTYHGVLAPTSGLRPKVVPRQLVEEGEAGGWRHGAGGGGEVSESAEAAVGKAVENVAVAALRRQQTERRVRAQLGFTHHAPHSAVFEFAVPADERFGQFEDALVAAMEKAGIPFAFHWSRNSGIDSQRLLQTCGA